MSRARSEARSGRRVLALGALLVGVALLAADGGRWALALLPYLLLIGWPLAHLARQWHAEGKADPARAPARRRR